MNSLSWSVMDHLYQIDLMRLNSNPVLEVSKTLLEGRADE